ncbi:MAG: class II fructose-bisphosphate aldolase [Armatimonadota bacterium]|nr:MAG: class II fructose-bisphosphate aldolase [Armatimonadota bacterium]
MPLVTSKELLQQAQAERYAVGAFNANNMECVKAVIEAAEEERAPVILQVSQGAIRYAGLGMATTMVQTVAQEASVPVVLHLDHGTSFLQNVQCLHAGFTSLMYDGAAEPLEKNIEISAKIAEIAHAVGLPVEAELGKIPKIEDYVDGERANELRHRPPAEQVEILRETAGPQVEALMADASQAATFVEKTGIDSLAAAVGSIHGMWADIWPLRRDRIEALVKATSLPLVCHGSSGVVRTRADAKAKGIELRPDECTLEEAVQIGICKVNVATAVSMAFLRGAREAWDERPAEKDLRKVLLPGLQAAKELVRGYMRLFGSSGRIAGAGRGETSEVKHAE